MAATVANADLISLGDPDSSDLFIVIDEGEMPPPESDVTPLTKSEVALIKDWIKSGAPVPAAAPVEASDGSSEEASGGASTSDEIPAGETAKKKEVTWLRKPLPRWLGHFHPLVIHFPIGLLTAAFLAELLSRVLKKPQLGIAATFCLTLGALGAIPSAGLGWLLAASTSHSGSDIDYHRWLGVSTAVIAVLCLRPFYTKPGLRLPIVTLLAILVGATGHLGGSLSYGSDWLDWPK